MLFPNADFQHYTSYLREFIDHPEWDMSVDIETIQPGSHIEELGISHTPTFGMSLKILKNRAPALPEKDELLLWQLFAKAVEGRKNVVMQNGAYDIGVLWYNQHILVQNLGIDTLIAAHICWPELARDLGFLGSICLDIPPWKSKSIRTSMYNAADATNTLGIAKVLEEELKRQKSEEQFKFEMSLIPVALMLQLNGIRVNREKQKELIEIWTKKRAELKVKLDEKIGRPINFNSPKQMCQLLYFDLQLPVQYKRRKHKDEQRTMTADATALRALSRLVPDNPVFNLILDYKKADTLINRFLDIELSPDDKVHTSYNITGASSDDEEDTKKTKRSFGRWSSSGSIILPYGSGNLQNIPPEARKMYRARPGHKIIQADYVQAEAVVMAYLTNNHKLINMFQQSYGLSKTERSEYDIHIMTFAQMTGIDKSKVTPEQRKIGKTIRHSTNYSAGPLVLANKLGISMKEAKKLIELYHNSDPSLRVWYSIIQRELQQTRVLVNLLGRKHRFLDRWGDSLFRSAYSYIPQSTVGDLLNKALLNIYNNQDELSFDLVILLQLHDAVYVEVPDDKVEETLRYLRKQMRIPLTCNNQTFYIDVDFKVGDSWAEGVEVDRNWREFDATLQ
jgi:DNA polymerase-1